ncbi:DUF222 domain-containing protein [Brachybacterium sp. YJGR34]|uniref:DUF222 domain-containing protein n=1 Tax=Brachybacterium sp. YJGR34 TaxID=2059911 RepID=UPI001E46A84B|nr:DUF222 domain-containing protein [Brachybacterium sp. YJGR34]
MLMRTPQGPSAGRTTPEETLAALRGAGPAALAEMLGDTAFLASAVAAEPGTMFAEGSRPREGYTSLLAQLHDLRSALEAIETRAVVALAAATRRDLTLAARDESAHEDAQLPSLDRLHRRADGRTARDYSLLTRRSPAAAGRTLASARRLVGSMPRMLASLAAGAVTGEVAYATASTAAPLDEGQRREVDEILHERMPSLDGAGTRRWRQAVATAIGELDPDGAARRHRRARRGRHVTVTPGEHGMATLSAHLPAIDAKLAHKRLSLEAERLRATGAREGHGALMADAMVGTLLGREGAMEPVTLDIGLVITDRSLLDPGTGDVAHVEGYGPVPAEAVRTALRAALAPPVEGEEDPCGPDGEAVRAVLRRLYTHPRTGELVAVESRARTFPPALRRFLTWRDVSCRGPFCDAAIRQCDHIDSAARGGATSLDNGQGTCGRCNLGKEDDAASVERLEDPQQAGHRVAWTGHGGAVRVTTAPALAPVDPSWGGDAPAGSTGTGEAIPCGAERPITRRIPEAARTGCPPASGPGGPARPAPVKMRSVPDRGAVELGPPRTSSTEEGTTHHDLSSTAGRAAPAARGRDRPGLGRPAARGRLRRGSDHRPRRPLGDGGASARAVRRPA